MPIEPGTTPTSPVDGISTFIVFAAASSSAPEFYQEW